MKYKRLGEIATIVDSLHQTPKYTDNGIPMVRVTDVKGGNLSLRRCLKVSEEDYRRFTRNHEPQYGDIVVSRVGTYGMFSFVATNEIFCLGQNTAIIIPKGNPLFLYFCLTSRGVKNQIEQKVVGSTQKTISLKNIKELEIPDFSLETQDKIVYVLKSIEDKIDVNNEINKNLLQQAQSIFNHEFLSIDSVPDGWQESSLLSIADYLNGLAMQKYRPKYDEQGLPVLKIKELRQGFCDSDSELCSPFIKPEYIVHDGDVIFSWSGSLLVDLWCGGTCGLNQHLFKVTSPTYDKWFYYAWTNHHLQKFAAIAADMATTMGHIKREELAKAKVLIPSKPDYYRIGELLAPLYDLVISNRIENRKLAVLRDELLPKLMSGQLDVSDI